METWDAYYADGTPAGRDLVRGEAIPEGLFHLVVEVTVRHADGDLQSPTFPVSMRQLRAAAYIRARLPWKVQHGN